MRRSLPAVAAGALWGALAAAVPATGQEVAYNGSVQYATGDYIFSERTHSVFFFNGLALSAGRLRISASVPVILQSTPWVSYTGGGVLPSGGPEHEVVRRGMGGRRDREPVVLPDTASFEELGVGDPVAHAEIELLPDRGALPALRLTGDVKFPLADVDRGFGTGEWDYAGGVSLSKVIGGTLVFGNVTYWVLGDLPDLRLKDPIAYSLGVGRPLPGGRVGVLLTFSGYTEVLDDVAPPAQLSLGVSYLLSGGRSVIGSASFGLSETSPDLSLSVGWHLPL